MKSEHRSSRVARATIPIVALFVVGLLTGGGPARADTASRLVGAKAQLDAVIAKMTTAARQRDALQADLATLLGQLDANARAIDDAQTTIDGLQRDIGTLAVQVSADQAALDARAVEVYTTGPGNGLQVLLGATSLSDLQDRIELVDAVSRSDADLISALTQRKNALAARQTELRQQQARLQTVRDSLATQASTLGTELAAQRSAVASLARDRTTAEALVGTLQTQRDRELARQRIQQAGGSSGSSGSGGSGGSGGSPPPSPPPPPPPPPPGSGSVQDMIRSDFGPLGSTQVDRALCVADRESNFDPNAQNPNSGAAGVYQFMPSTWTSLSSAAGYGGHSVFEAAANVGTAEWTVAHYGWSAWSGDGPYCGF